MEYDKIYDFLMEFDKLKRVYRKSILSDFSRNENSAEHSWHLSIAVMMLHGEIPESIEVEFIPSKEYPQGVGESGTPLVACCIANAFLALTGKPLTHLPFTPEKVLEVLNA